jgi:hypothetical protein
MKTINRVLSCPQSRVEVFYADEVDIALNPMSDVSIHETSCGI